MLSNKLVIGVVQPESRLRIVRVVLRSDKNRVKVGEKINFYVDAFFNRIASADDVMSYNVDVVVYVNGSKIKEYTDSIQEGSNEYSGSFTLSFSKPGKYTVWVDVTLHGGTSNIQLV